MSDTLDWIARIAIAFYFLWAAQWNIKERAIHVAEFRRIGIARGRAALALGVTLQVVGSVLLLVPQTVVWGAITIMAFTVTADALFHRYWQYEDPHERTIHKFFLLEHVALLGGLLSVLAYHSK